jgi:hypothetical protein
MALHCATGLEVMDRDDMKAVSLIVAIIAVATIIAITAAWILVPSPTSSTSRNGCTSTEAWIELNGRDTCYPTKFLPPELMYYLEPK